MPYIGKSPEHGNFAELTDVSGSFNGSTTQFALTTRIGGIAITPVVEAALLISLDGVIQEPTTDYRFLAQTLHSPLLLLLQFHFLVLLWEDNWMLVLLVMGQ